MKILVLSDSHRNVNRMLCAVAQEEPNRIFHLGDLSRDAEELADTFPNIPLTMVFGNCDLFFGGGTAATGTAIETAMGVRMMLTHGHHYSVKQGLSTLINEARKREVRAVLFGHTHEPVLKQQPDGLWVINPGTIGGVGNIPTYAVLTITKGEFSAEIKEL